MNRHLPVVAVVLLLCSFAVPVAAQDDPAPMLRLREFKAERLAALPQAAAAAKGPKTVVVDCTKKNSSISDALAKNNGPLVIEIHGVCKENVLVERNDLTLRGTDPASDGIQGVIADPQPAALKLSYANRILVENMFVADSPDIGVAAWFSTLEMRNCRIANNGSNGIHITASSGLTGTELVVSENAGFGIKSQRGGYVTCLGCRLENNLGWAAASGLGGFITLWDTVVSYAGISADGAGSYVDVDCVNVDSNYPCSVNGEGRAASASNGGMAYLLGVGAFRGRVLAVEGGTVGVYGGQQTIPLPDVYPNQVSYFGRLETGVAEEGGPTTTLGRTRLGTFSHAVLENATVLSSTLTCDSGADAWSDTPYFAAQVIRCEHVPIAQ